MFVFNCLLIIYIKLLTLYHVNYKAEIMFLAVLNRGYMRVHVVGSQELSSSYYMGTRICTSSMFELISLFCSVLIAEIRVSFYEGIRRTRKGMEKGVTQRRVTCSVFEARAVGSSAMLFDL